jgi:hypothetical protein
VTREQLEHTIRAAGAIAEDDELYVVGSQSILGAYPNAHPDLLQSMEVDIAPKNKPKAEEMIEGAIGELSLFHDTFGYFVDGVDIDGIKLPLGWQNRLVAVLNANTRGVTGLCIDPCDLAVSKLFAGREKDVDFIRVMVREQILSISELGQRINASGFDDATRAQLRTRVAHLSAP